MKKLNVSQICSVKVYINTVCSSYVYKMSKKIIFFWRTKEGFYDVSIFPEKKYKTVEEIEKSGKFICKGQEVYYKPHLFIRMNDGSSSTKYFDSELELKSFVDNHLLSVLNLIDIS